MHSMSGPGAESHAYPSQLGGQSPGKYLRETARVYLHLEKGPT